MTQFTNEDLKRLKEARRLAANHLLPGSLIDALLARLEAAEVCAQHFAEEYEDYGEPCIEAWRKAKGDVSDNEQACGR